MYPMLGCKGMLVRCKFPKGWQNLDEKHSAAVANGADIAGLCCKGFVAGFPVEQLRIVFCWWSVEDLAAK